MNKFNRKPIKFLLIVGTILLLGIGIYSALAQVDISQPPSAFDITTDGVFTTPVEWSDVVPAARLLPIGIESFVYTAVDPDKDALYLMYDLPGSAPALPLGTSVGPVHFHNGGHLFEVFFVVGGPPPGIIVFKDGVLLNLFQGNLEPSMEGAVGFGTSPNSNDLHNMLELEVLFDGSDGTLAGHNHGQYSPDPSHWGASVQQQDRPQPVPVPEFSCPRLDGDKANFHPAGHSQDKLVVQTAPGDKLAVSSACVQVVRGTGGRTLIDELVIPGEVAVRQVRIDIKPGSFPNSINLKRKGTTPVAILSTPTFDAPTAVDKSSLTFGRRGSEAQGRCTKSDEDVNGDGRLDVVCHFDNQNTGFRLGDTVGILRGRTVVDGAPIVGSDSVRILDT